MKASGLREVFSLLQHAAKAESKVLQPEPPKLLELIHTLHRDRAVKPPRARPDVVPKWKSAIESGNFSPITLSDVRALFWEKEVALSNQFLEHLFQRKINIRRSSIKGFVFALASRWDEVLDGKLHLNQYQHVLSQLSKSDFLERITPYILDPAGHSRFAEQVIQKKVALSDLFTDIFGIVIPSSQYTSEVIGVISETAYAVALSDARKDREWFYEAILRHLGKGRLITCLGKIVRGIENSNAEDAKEELKGFILSHLNLGDPRLPHFESNWDKGDAVTQAIIEWLSQSDVNFFFELFFEAHADKQGRKRFWLPYAHLIRGTRVIVSQTDKKRLQRQLMDLDTKKVSKSIFGSLLDQNEKATAFIMDFGAIKVVEFSLAGHACYYYDTKCDFRFNDRTRFWDTQTFRESELKDKSKCSKPLRHVEGWESRFSNLLAGYGIRPKSKSRGYY